MKEKIENKEVPQTDESRDGKKRARYIPPKVESVQLSDEAAEALT